MSLIVLFLLHQIFFGYGRAKHLLIIKRLNIRNETVDRFDVTGLSERASCVEKCGNFNTTVDTHRTEQCACVCSRQAATLGRENGAWHCIDNRVIREKELTDCRKTYFTGENDADPLKLFKENDYLKIKTDTKCSDQEARLSYQECDGNFILQKEKSGWHLTSLWTDSRRDLTLKMNDDGLEDFHGKVIKLVIPCENPKELCLLFKIAGEMKCPLNNISIPKSPLPTATVVKRLSSEMVVSTPDSRTSKKSVSSTKPNPKASMATNPILRVTDSQEHNWKRNKDSETIKGASHKLSIPLVSVIAGGAAVVFLVSLFTGLLIYRKRNEKNSHKSSLPLKRKTTRADNDNDQNKYAGEKPIYQSLSPLENGDLPRGVYVQRYKVPEAASRRISEELLLQTGPKASTEEYDYAESCLMVRNKGLNVSSSVPIKAPAMTTENDPYYHVLQIEEDVLSPGPCSDAHRIPEERAPIRLPQDSNLVDLRKTFDNDDDEGAQVDKDTDTYYHILEPSESEDPESDGQMGSNIVAQSPSPNSPEPEGYKQLPSEGQVYKGYQALHKYTYITAGDPVVK